jgi:hypothetical protein
MQQRPPPSLTSIALASSMILAILVLAVPGVVSIFAPAPAVIITTPAAIPTAAPPTAAPAGPPAGLSALPATLPAGATADDRMFTVYAGWPYRATGARSGDSCELEIWPYGNPPSDRLWVDCSPVGL